MGEVTGEPISNVRYIDGRTDNALGIAKSYMKIQKSIAQGDNYEKYYF